MKNEWDYRIARHNRLINFLVIVVAWFLLIWLWQSKSWPAYFITGILVTFGLYKILDWIDEFKGSKND